MEHLILAVAMMCSQLGMYGDRMNCAARLLGCYASEDAPAFKETTRIKILSGCFAKEAKK